MEYLIVIIVIIAIAYFNYGILPKIKEKNLLKERNAVQQIDNEYKQLFTEAKTAIANGDLESGKEKILKSVYFPISPVNLSGCNDANSYVYYAKIKDKMKRLDEAINHAETAFEELENLYNSKKIPVSCAELRQQLSILSTISKEVFEKQGQIVELNNKLAFSAINANFESIKQSEYEKKIKSEIDLSLKEFAGCLEASFSSKDIIKKLLDELPKF